MTLTEQVLLELRLMGVDLYKPNSSITVSDCPFSDCALQALVLNKAYLTIGVRNPAYLTDAELLRAVDGLMKHYVIQLDLTKKMVTRDDKLIALLTAAIPSLQAIKERWEERLYG